MSQAVIRSSCDENRACGRFWTSTDARRSLLAPRRAGLAALAVGGARARVRRRRGVQSPAVARRCAAVARRAQLGRWALVLGARAPDQRSRALGTVRGVRGPTRAAGRAVR